MSQKRITKEGVYYHITNHFHQGVIRFIDKRCKKVFLDICRKAKEKFSFKIKNICVMDTHIHILIKPDNGESISDIMKFIKQCFTQWLNYRFGIKGTAWEARFFSKIVEFTEDIVRTFIYIEQNPIRAGLVGGGLGNKIAQKIKSFIYPFYEVWEPLSQEELS